MMERSYSQKVARVFEIVGYVMLLPAAVGGVTGLFAIKSEPLFALGLFAVLGVGIALLVGYLKHSGGRLSEKYYSALWLTTAVFNFLLLLPWLYLASMVLEHGWHDFQGHTSGGAVVFYFLLVGVVCVYVAAIGFSLKAYAFEKRKKLL